MRDIRSFPKQNSTVLISVVISMISVLFIIALGNGLANNIADQLKPTSSRKLSFLYLGKQQTSLKNEDVTFLKKFSEVKSFQVSSDEKMSTTEILFHNNQQTQATVGKINDFSTVKVLQGNVDSLNNNDYVFINKSALWIRPSNLNSLINTQIYLNDKGYKISGLYTTNLLDGGNIPDILISSENFKNLGLHVPNNKLTISFKLNSKQDLQKLEDKIMNKYDELHSNDGSLVVLDDTSLSKSMHNLVNRIALSVVIVASISLVISGFSISSSMYANIAIRSSEIGLRRTLGATRKNIRNQFISEALILLIAGVLIGDIVSQIFILIIRSFGVNTYITLTEMLLIGLIPIAIGFISSISPATIAANKNITDILRSEYN